MLRTVYGQVSFAVLVCVVLAAAAFGGRSERIGAAVVGAGSLGGMIAQMTSGLFDPVATLFLIDVLVMAGLVALTWRSGVGWPFFAVACQGVGLAVHLIRTLSPSMHPWIYLTSLAATEYGVLASLAGGIWIAARSRIRPS